MTLGYPDGLRLITVVLKRENLPKLWSKRDRAKKKWSERCSVVDFRDREREM